MPNRIIRDGINSSERINKLSMGAEILYRRLMSVVDDYGRFHGAPITILGACWPTCPDKFTLKQVRDWLEECRAGDRPLIETYSVGGAQYIQLSGFGQNIRSKSKFPDYDSNLHANCAQLDSNPSTDCEQNAVTRRSSYTNANTNANTNAKSADAALDSFSRFWEAYPKKADKTAAAKAWAKLPMTEELLAVMLAALEVQKFSQQWTKDGGQFIPNPATWINHKRWEDSTDGAGGQDNSRGAGGPRRIGTTREHFAEDIDRAFAVDDGVLPGDS